MPAHLTKPIQRLTPCGIVAQIREDGIAIRLPHKKTWLFATWKQIASAGFINGGAKLSVEEWGDPLNTVFVKTAAALRRGRKPKKKELGNFSSKQT